MKLQRALSLLQLLIGETIALFIAGIAVPSFLRSGTATNHALAAGILQDEAQQMKTAHDSSIEFGDLKLHLPLYLRHRWVDGHRVMEKFWFP